MPLGISRGAVVDPVAAPQEKAQCPGVGLPDSDLGEVVLGHGMLKQAASQPLALLVRGKKKQLQAMAADAQNAHRGAGSCTVWRGRALWSAWTVAVQRASNRAIHAGERS